MGATILAQFAFAPAPAPKSGDLVSAHKATKTTAECIKDRGHCRYILKNGLDGSGLLGGGYHVQLD